MVRVGDGYLESLPWKEIRYGGYTYVWVDEARDLETKLIEEKHFSDGIYRYDFSEDRKVIRRWKKGPGKKASHVVGVSL